MANPTSAFGWQMPTSTDLVTDLPADFEVFGQAVDTSLADLKGGTTGQVLSKATNADMDFTWVTTDDANAIQNSIVDAKGDLIAASANDTPARLAVGANGETLVADSSTSTGLRYQSGYNGNGVINGGYDIWQRSTSATFTGSVSYPATDRWFGVVLGSASTSTMSRQTADTTGLTYGMRFGRNSGQTATGGVYTGYTFESLDARRFAGQTVTLSFYAKKGADAPATLTSSIRTGTGTDQTAATLFSAGWTGGLSTAQNNTTTSTMTRYTQTLSLDANVNQIMITFNYAPTGTAGANEWFQIEGVQLELGSVATNFKRSSGGTIQGELAACQRYYWRNTTGTTYGIVGTGMSYAATNSYIVLQPPVTMRTLPASVDFGNLRVTDLVNYGLAVTAVTLSATESDASMMKVQADHATGATAYRPAYLAGNNNTAAFIGLSAEL